MPPLPSVVPVPVTVKGAVPVFCRNMPLLAFAASMRRKLMPAPPMLVSNMSIAEPTPAPATLIVLTVPPTVTVPLLTAINPSLVGVGTPIFRESKVNEPLGLSNRLIAVVGTFDTEVSPKSNVAALVFWIKMPADEVFKIEVAPVTMKLPPIVPPIPLKRTP